MNVKSNIFISNIWRLCFLDEQDMEGLIERLIGQKGWILRKTKIESIWYKETDCIVLWIHLTQKIAKIAFLIQS